MVRIASGGTSETKEDGGGTTTTTSDPVDDIFQTTREVSREVQRTVDRDAQTTSTTQLPSNVQRAISQAEETTSQRQPSPNVQRAVSRAENLARRPTPTPQRRRQSSVDRVLRQTPTTRKPTPFSEARRPSGAPRNVGPGFSPTPSDNRGFSESPLGQFLSDAEPDKAIVEAATTGGLFARDEPRQLQQPPSQIDVPDTAPGADVLNPEEKLTSDILERNPSLERDDITVTRTESGRFQIETDLDPDDIRERIAAENPGVAPGDVTFRETDDGEVVPVTFEDTTEPFDFGDGPVGTQLTGFTRRDVEMGVAEFNRDVKSLDISTTATGAPIITGFDEDDPDTELPFVTGGVKFVSSAPLTADTAVAIGTGAPTIASRSVEDPGAAGATAAVVGADVARSTVKQLKETPIQAAGTLAVGGAVGAAASPLRLRALRVPNVKGSTTAVRGARLETPPALRAVGVRQRGTTIVGTRGFRPTVGAPGVRPEKVDFTRLEGRGATGLEPVGDFETEVAGATAKRVGPGAASRARAARRVGKLGSRTRTELRVETAEEIVSEARAVPGEKVPDVADALRELDAEVFGSAAVRAQIEGTRQPRDVDIVVSDKGTAEARLGEALEGASADVRDVFDIKTTAEKPRPGETVKLGEPAQERLATEGGVRVAPASEELLKKAGASVFLRGPGSPGRPFVGTTDDVDIGPEPVAPGKPPRVKDPGDAAAIAEATFIDTPGGVSRFNPFERVRRARGRRALSKFKTEFDPEIETSDAIVRPVERPQAGLREVNLQARKFLEDTRGQAGLIDTRRARRDVDIDTDGPARPRDVDDDLDTTPSRRSPSPGKRSPGAGLGSPFPAAKPTPSPTPSPSPSDFDAPSPGGSPVPDGQPPSVVSDIDTVPESKVPQPPGGDSPPSPPPPPPSPPTGGPGPPTVPSITTPVPGFGPGPFTTSGLPPSGDEQGEDFSARFAFDFSKTFEAEIADFETVVSGSAKDLSDPESFTEPGGRFLDTDLTPRVTETSDELTDEEFRNLIEGEGPDL